MNLGINHNELPSDRTLDNKTRTCNKCQKVYEPTEADISTRRLNLYYKLCSDCRQRARTSTLRRQKQHSI